MPRISYLVVALAALLIPIAANAQYLYLDANGDGVHTDADAVNPSGATHVDVWLDSNHDRDGTLQSCNGHTGAPVDPDFTVLDVFSYDIYLVAEHGTVSWGDFQDKAGFYTPPNQQYNTHTDTRVHVQRFAELGHELTPGRHKLGSFTISCTAGTPLVRLGLMENWDFCAFGTHCTGGSYPNSYIFGTDFFDADGLRYGGPQNHEPVFDPVAPVIAVQNHATDVTMNASDEDLQPLTYSKVSGPDFVTVSTLPLAGQGNLHVAPGSTDLGPFSVQVRVSDGVFFADRFVSVTVRRELVMHAIEDVTVQAGDVTMRYLGADNPLNAPLTYSVVSGPAFVTVHQSPNEVLPGPPYLSFAPATPHVGDWPVTVRVTNGSVQDETTFQVHVTAAPVPDPILTNHPPAAVIRGPDQGVAGRPVSFNGGNSTDPDRDPLTCTWYFDDGSSRVANSRADHVFAAEGDYHVELTVNDRMFFATSSQTVHILPAASARAFLSKPEGNAGDLVVHVQPILDSFETGELTEKLRSTYSLSSAAGDRITAIALDRVGSMDADRDGAPDQGIVFSASDLARLTNGAAEHGVALLTLRGVLSGGGQFAASVALSPSRGKGPLSAELSPNPLNPVGLLTFTTARTGPVDVKVYDIAGRLAQHPVAATLLPAGYHEVLVGRGRQGADLPSGIYFYRIETAEGVERGRFAVVR